MRIAVIGAGAVGGYFGGRLAEAGEEVTFIARGQTLQALRERGLRITGQGNEIVLDEVAATDDIASVGPVEIVLLAVKAWQVPEVASSLAPLLGPQSCVVPLQNGVEAPDQLARELGTRHVLGGLCKIISRVAAPGHIEHIGAEPYVAFGELDGSLSQRGRNLERALRQSGVRAELTADIRAEMWKKFLFIAAVSGLGAVTRSPIGVLRQLPETRELLVRALREAWAVASGQGIELPEETLTTTLEFIDRLPSQATASMQRDLMAGRPSELEFQNGTVVRLGEQAGVETPVHAFFYHCLLPLERRARHHLSDDLLVVWNQI